MDRYDLYLVEFGEKGSGLDNGVRFVGVFSSASLALDYCRGEGKQEHFGSARAGGEQAAFIISEISVDHHGFGRTRYLWHDGTIHDDWPQGERPRDAPA